MTSPKTSWKTPLAIMKIAALGLIGILLIGVYLKTEHNTPIVSPRQTSTRLKEYPSTTIDLSSFDLPQSKYLLISFWATWCPTCKPELKQLQELKQKLKSSDFEIVSVNLDPLNNQQKVNEVWKSLNLDLNLILGSEKAFFKIFEIDVLPSSFFIKNNSTLLWRLDGSTDWYSEKTLNLIKKHLLERTDVSL